jgi:hypothetical protein
MPVVHDVRRDVDRPSGSDVQGVARRLDWRFLLPTVDDAPLERLRLLGGDARTAELVVEAGVAGTVVTAPDDGPVDAVISLSGEVEDLGPLLTTLRPGGVLYCEVDRASRRTIGWSAPRLDRRLRRAGFRTAVYWRRRRRGHDNLFLPLDAPGAVPWYLREVIDDRGLVRRLARSTLRLLVRGDGHRLGVLARRYSVVAVADLSRSRPRRALASPALLGARSTDVVPAVLAGGEGAWSRVVLLPFGPTDSQPREVLKLPRTAEHNRATEREQRTLARLRSALPSDLAAGLPSARGIRTWSGLCVGSESFVPGRPVGLLSRRRAGSTLPAAVDWLIRLDTATGEALADETPAPTREVFDETFRTTVETLRLPLDGEEVCRRFGVRGIGEAPVPVVWQHGDLTPSNLRWDGTRHAVVDWESARPGPALCDLLYFLLHWPWLDLPRFGMAPAKVLDAVFLSDRGRPADSASTQVRRYCAALGVDDAMVAPLLLRMLGQQALDRADRIRDIGLDPAEDQNVYADLFCRVATAPGPARLWARP